MSGPPVRDQKLAPIQFAGAPPVTTLGVFLRMWPPPPEVIPRGSDPPYPMCVRPGLIARTAIVPGPAGRTRARHRRPCGQDYTSLVQNRPRPGLVRDASRIYR